MTPLNVLTVTMEFLDVPSNTNSESLMYVAKLTNPLIVLTDNCFNVLCLTMKIMKDIHFQFSYVLCC